MAREFVEDMTGFHISERVISRISPQLFLKYKMQVPGGPTHTPEYRALCDDLYEKTGLHILLAYCHKNVCTVLGNNIEKEMTFVTGKRQVWASTSFDTLKLLSILENYSPDDTLEKSDMFPFRWTPEKAQG